MTFRNKTLALVWASLSAEAQQTVEFFSTFPMRDFLITSAFCGETSEGEVVEFHYVDDICAMGRESVVASISKDAFLELVACYAIVGVCCDCCGHEEYLEDTCAKYGVERVMQDTFSFEFNF